MKSAWWWIGASCRIFIVLFVASVLARLFFQPLPFGPSERQFTDLTGEQAVSRLGEVYWFKDVDIKDIEKASGKIYSEFDCHAGWFRIILGPEPAEKYQNAIHLNLEKSENNESDNCVIEGVHRVITNSMFPEAFRDKAPKWWNPPSVDFRVTEKMKWYPSTSRYAQALYSGFDPSTKTLWIYDFGQQHLELWPRGAIPPGTQFVLNSRTDHKKPKALIQSSGTEND
jgi:hypothetical protein